MPKRATITIEDTPSPRTIKDDPDAQDESSTPPPTTPKKAKKSSSSPSTTGSSTKKSPAPRKMPESAARTAKGRFMEMLIESGLKSINKKDVQEETALSAAQQAELFRKDKGALRRACGGFVSSL